MYPCKSGNFERHLRPNKGAQFATKSGEIDVLSWDFQKNGGAFPSRKSPQSRQSKLFWFWRNFLRLQSFKKIGKWKSFFSWNQILPLPKRLECYEKEASGMPFILTDFWSNIWWIYLPDFWWNFWSNFLWEKKWCINFLMNLPSRLLVEF